jgi:hypothetical protein
LCSLFDISCEQKPDKEKAKSDLTFESINKTKLQTRQSNENKQKNSLNVHDDVTRENKDVSIDRHKNSKHKRSTKSADAWSPNVKSNGLGSPKSPNKSNGKEPGRSYPKSILHKGLFERASFFLVPAFIVNCNFARFSSSTKHSLM